MTIKPSIPWGFAIMMGLSIVFILFGFLGVQNLDDGCWLQATCCFAISLVSLAAATTVLLMIIGVI